MTKKFCCIMYFNIISVPKISSGLGLGSIYPSYATATDQICRLAAIYKGGGPYGRIRLK